MKSILLSVLFAFVTVPTMAATASTCIYKRSVSGFSVPKDQEKTIEVSAGIKDYSIKVSFCTQNDLRFADTISFKSISSWVCKGDDLYVYQTGGFDSHCVIDSIEEL